MYFNGVLIYILVPLLKHISISEFIDTKVNGYSYRNNPYFLLYRQIYSKEANRIKFNAQYI